MRSATHPTTGTGPKGPVGGLPSRRVMIVDDNRDVVDSYTFLLEALGQTVASAYDGKTALQLAPEFVPDIMLLDIEMPGMTGFYVSRVLRRMPELKNTRILAHSGFGRAEYRAATAATGFDGYASKPIAYADLIRILLDGPLV